jgi:predicted transglutaminase-like cysteine proteinase
VLQQPDHPKAVLTEEVNMSGIRGLGLSRPATLRRCFVVLGASLALSMVPAQAVQATGTAVFISTKSAAAAPSGAADLCQRYDWACQTSGPAALSGGATLPTVRKVNRQVNQTVRSIADSVQYGVKEVWTLPSRTGGDCEDYALLKKQKLIAKGIPAQQLLLATVFGARTGSHAVLILRLAEGDYVLDNMTDQIRHWSETEYTFLRIQNPEAPSRWMTVFAGG